MSREIVLDNEHVTVWYLPEYRIVHHQFHGFICGAPFRNALEAGTAVLKKHGAQKWLSDDRANSALPLEDSTWGKTVWFPLTRDAGWKFWAVVQPSNVMGQMNMKRFARECSKQGVTVKVFDDPDDALLWLKEQKEQ